MQESLKISFTITPKEPLTVFALVIGGFYPLFAYSGLLLLDRNIVINSETIANKRKHHDLKANIWWFNFINNENYYLNPVLAASESKMCIPNYPQFLNEIERFQSVLQIVFPSANLVSFTEEANMGAYALMCEITEDYEKEVNFLKQTIPLVLTPKRINELADIEKQIFDYYLSNGLKNSWILLLACLSCLYESP